MRSVAAFVLAVLSLLAMSMSRAGAPVMDIGHAVLSGLGLALMFWSGCVAGSLLTDRKRR